jgi:hypothetical protein
MNQIKQIFTSFKHSTWILFSNACVYTQNQVKSSQIIKIKFGPRQTTHHTRGGEKKEEEKKKKKKMNVVSTL